MEYSLSIRACVFVGKVEQFTQVKLASVILQ